MKRKPSAIRGFTLIEILIVIAIIAILAGLLLRTAGYVQKKGAVSRAEAEMSALTVALENYKADHGDYPQGSNVDGVNALIFEYVDGTGRSFDSANSVAVLPERRMRCGRRLSPCSAVAEFAASTRSRSVRGDQC